MKFFVGMGSIALMAVLSIPAALASNDGSTGALDGYVSVGHIESDDSDFDGANPFLIGGGVIYQAPIGPGYGYQAEASVQYGTGMEGQSVGNEFFNYGGVIHLFARNPERHAAGVFAGVGSYDVIQSSGGPEVNTYLLAGVEGQLFWDDFTLYGQAGYFDPVDDCSECYRRHLYELLYMRLTGRYFITPNTVVEGEFGIGRGYVEGDDQAPLDFWAIEVEHMLPNGVSVYGRYDHGYFCNCDEDDPMNQQFIRVGVRWYWNGGTLQFNDRNGHSFDTPDFARYVAVSDQFD